jgi:hypothetical protein
MLRFKQIALLAVLPLVLMSCAESGNRRAVSQPTSTLVAPSATSRIPTPGPVPSNCPVTIAHPQPVVPNLGPVIGSSPVWANWPPGPSIIHLILPPPYPSDYEAPYGWQAGKVIWEVGPNYTNLITVSGHDIFDNTSLFFQFDAAPIANAVLDPKNPNHPSPAGGHGWAEWGSYIVVPKAGCYQMDVSWPTGHWSVTFAAGA